ncbi:MAG: undecaprenyl/decaprenyl-phosphate alpha-N-acetylglucosaminyl 1-phosphate transferase [Chitinophagaceae bacterium]|nr:undecaprenyl/decaprenyl-phosphate alpha-N-acetylglucosaminyl 1-phosphate transferase [Chitinophagaceae bacterium]
MIEMLMSLALAFGISFYALPALIHIANEKRLFDYPDERKVHHNPIPSLGGLAIYAGFITAFLLTVAFSGRNFVFQYLVAASVIMFFVGLKDDLLNIAPFKKFLGQILAASLLVFKGGLVISSMEGVLGIYDLQPVAAQALSVATIVVVINAFNLIDGVDGLAGTLALLSTGFFATYFAINGDYTYACLATSLIGALAAFLIFNYPPARIFMGDTGSLLVGLISSALVIRFIQTAGQGAVWPIESGAAVGFSVLFIPLFDTLRVFSYRIVHGIPPFTPDRNHIHHILMRFDWSHLRITLVLGVTSLVFMAMAILLQPLGTPYLLLSLLGVGFSVVGVIIWVYHAHRRRLMKQQFPRIVPREENAPVVPVAPRKAANS